MIQGNFLRVMGGSITFKLILLLVFVSLLPLIAIAYYSLNEGTKSLEEQEQANMRLLAVSTAGRLDQLMFDTEHTVRMLAGDAEVAAFLAADANKRHAYRATVDRSLFNIRDSVQDFAQVYLMDRNGVFVAATNSKVIGKPYDFREYFQNAIKGNYYRSELIFGSTSGEAGIYFSGPVHADDGTVIGVAVLKLKGEAVFRLLDAMSDAAGRRSFLVDGNQIVIHHPDPAWSFRSLIPVDSAAAEAILKRTRYPVSSLDSLGLMDLSAALAADDSGNLRLAKHFNGSRLVAGFAPMSAKSWTVVVTEPEEVFAQPLHRLFVKSMAGVAVVVVLGVLLSVVLGRMAGKPISRLIRAAAFMERGDYLNSEEPFSPAMLQLEALHDKRDELGRLARVFEDMAGQVYRRHEELETLVAERTQQLAAKNAELQRAQQRIAQELRVAHSLQQSILPTRFPAHQRFDLCAAMQPAREMGGDFYDFFALDERYLGLVMADVSGKGVPAAFFMAVARTLVQNLAMAGGTPGEVMARANDLLNETNPLQLFVTVIYGILDLETGEFRYANGGHNPPLRVAKSGQVEPLPLTGGTALGVMDGLVYREHSLQLQSGDVLVLFTDGVTEAFAADGQAYGDERLVQTVATAWGQPASSVVGAIVDSVAAFTDGADPSDDLTCLTLHYHGHKG